MSYLRQPSPLSFEPLSPSPSDIVESNSECETDSDSRKAKRRRVEDLGRQYLAGRPLFIQSASLKGPFDNGWVNPWKKRGRGNLQHGATDRQERLVGEFITDKVAHSGAKGQLEDVSNLAPGHPRHSQQVPRYLDKASTTASVLDIAARPKKTAQEQLVLTEQEKRGSQKQEKAPTAGLLLQNRARRTVEPAVGLNGPPKGPYQDKTPRSLISAANEWLKSDNGYLAEQSWEEPRSATPTPTSRAGERRTPSRQNADPRTPTQRTSREDLLAPSRPAGFTPINVPSPSVRRLYNQDAQERKSPTSQSPSNAPVTARKPQSFSPKLCQRKSTDAGTAPRRTESRLPGMMLDSLMKAAATTEISLPSEATRDPIIKASVTKLSPVPARGQDLTSPKRPVVAVGEPESTTSYHPLPTARIGGVLAKQSHSRPPPSVLNKASVNEDEPSCAPPDNRSRVQTVPPSTNMSAFKYRRHMKTVPGPRLESAQAGVEPSAFGNRQVQKPKKLDFSSSNDSPRKAAPPTSTAPVESEGGAVQDARPSQHGRDFTFISREELSVNLNSADKQIIEQQIDEPHRISSVFQEAQVVPDPAGKDAQVPSASSTNLMETDKQSLHFSTETEDASAHLSTQAAIAKAQLSFKADLISPMKQCIVPSPEKQDCNVINYNNVSSRKAPKHIIAPFQTFRTPTPERSTPTTSRADEHLSTQQMIDAVTPFAFSTTKKPKTKKRISFTNSIIDGQNHDDFDHVNEDHQDFGHSSLDMETSPDTSDAGNGRTRGPRNGQVLEKNDSTANSTALPVSFSIAPNGTLKEVFQQDGQVEDAVMGLGAVLDDVGSFLQSWDIEAELKKSTGSSTTGPNNPGSRQHTGISSGRRKGSRT